MRRRPASSSRSSRRRPAGTEDHASKPTTQRGTIIVAITGTAERADIVEAVFEQQSIACDVSFLSDTPMRTVDRPAKRGHTKRRMRSTS
jgi:hypothetical protein